MSPFTLLWQQHLPQAPAGAMQLTATHLVAATKDVLYGFRPADGFQEWQYPLPNDTVVWFQPAGDRLVMSLNPQSWSERPAEVRILNTAALGRLERRWLPAGASHLSAPAVMDNFIYVVADNETLCWLDMATGVVGMQPLSRPVATVSPLVTPERIYLTGRSNDLLAIEANANGNFCSLFETSDKEMILTHTPVLAGPYLLVTTRDGQLLALQNGQLVWQRAIGAKIGPPAANRNLVCIGSDKGVYGLELATGQEVWHFPTKRSVMARPVITANVVYTAGHDHFLYALAIESGRELWHYGPTLRRLEYPPLLSCPLLTLLDAAGNLLTLQLST